MVRERVSSATVLLLAFTGKNLRYFHVRKNAIVLKCDWPHNPAWDDGFYQWLRASSRLTFSPCFLKLWLATSKH